MMMMGSDHYTATLIWDRRGQISQAESLPRLSVPIVNLKKTIPVTDREGP
jgi:hypothetical protein